MFLLSLHSMLCQELWPQRVRLWPRSRCSGSRSVMARWDHSHSAQHEHISSSMLWCLKGAVDTNKIKNMNKPTGHIWLYFIIKAIKTEPCPYVYIWSGVTVMSGGGQRGTGYDYVLSFFLLLLSHMVKVREAGEGGDRRDFLDCWKN